MFRAICVVAGCMLIVTVALAAGDIPTRYSGSFPSSYAKVSNITGTFTGKGLVLNYVFKRGQVLERHTGRFTCASAPPNMSNCSGSFSANGKGSKKGNVSITWSKGLPVAVQISM
jgi:hypothetical protein